MIRLFPKCKAYLTAGCALTFMIAAALYKDVMKWYWALLVFVLGCALVFFIVSCMAYKLHGKLLSVLYVSMKPRDFLSFYAKLTDTDGLRANVRFTMKAYLCDAYVAAGEFKKALSVTDSLPEISGRNREKAAAIAAAKRCGIALYTGDAAAAEKELALFPELPDRELLAARLSILKGTSSERDADTVREALKVKKTPLEKTELWFFCGCIYEILGNTEFSRAYFSDVAKADRQLFIANKAAEKLKQ